MMMRLLLVLVVLVSITSCAEPNLWTEADDAVQWKKKFIEEVNQHYETQQNMNADTVAVQIELQNIRTYVDIMEAKVESLEKDNAHLKEKLAEEGELKAELGALRKTVSGLVKEIADLKKKLTQKDD